MQEAGAVHRRQRRAQIQADERRFPRPERAASLEDLLERLAAHQFHPEADAVVVMLGAVHLHDVRVPDPRKAPRLLENPSVRLGMIPFVVEQLQRYFTLERCVPGAVDLA